MTDARFLGFSDCIEVKYCGELDSSEHISSEERVAVRTDKHQARLTPHNKTSAFSTARLNSLRPVSHRQLHVAFPLPPFDLNTLVLAKDRTGSMHFHLSKRERFVFCASQLFVRLLRGLLELSHATLAGPLLSLSLVIRHPHLHLIRGVIGPKEEEHRG